MDENDGIWISILKENPSTDGLYYTYVFNESENCNEITKMAYQNKIGLIQVGVVKGVCRNLKRNKDTMQQGNLSTNIIAVDPKASIILRDRDGNIAL